MRKTCARSLGWDDLLEKEMPTHSSILAWDIPWTEDSGGLQSTGSQSWTQLSDYTFTIDSFGYFFFSFLFSLPSVVVDFIGTMKSNKSFELFFIFFFSFSLSSSVFFFLFFSLFYDFNFLKPIIYFYTFIPLFAFPTILFPLQLIFNIYKSSSTSI